MSSTMTVKIYHRGLVLDCEVSTWPPCKGARDGKYGPPIEPDDPGGFEVEEVKFVELDDQGLTPEEVAEIMADDDAIYQAVADELAGWEPDYDDY